MNALKRFATSYLPAILLLLLILITWEILAGMDMSEKFKLMAPAPSRIFISALATDDDNATSLGKAAGNSFKYACGIEKKDQENSGHIKLLTAGLNSFKYAGAGFLLSFIFGNLLAFIMSMARFVERSIYPYAIFLQTVPIVAIAPIIILWIGAGPQGIICITFIISLFPIITNSTSGLTSTPKEWSELMDVYKANWLQILFKLRLPAAVPSMITGAKISAGLSVVGAIVGEYFTALSTSDNSVGYGLAYLLQSSQEHVNFPYLFAVAFASAIMGLGIFATVSISGLIVMKLGHFQERAI